MIRKILKLPVGDPPLPDGDPDSVQIWKPGGGYFKYRVFLFAFAGLPSITLTIGLLGMGALGAITSMGGQIPFFVQAAIAGFMGLIVLRILGGAAFGLYRIRLELDMLRYILTDQAVRLRRGVMDIEEITLSFANIQNVKMNQGFLQRMFGVADLIVETAGGGSGAEVGGHVGRILGVSEPEALREAILERAKSFKGSGLGQVTRRTAALPVAANSRLATPEAAALLREIVTDLQAIRLTPPSGS